MVDGLLMRRLSNATNNNTNCERMDKSAWSAYENQSQSSTSALTADESLSSHQTISERSGSASGLGGDGSVNLSSSNIPSSNRKKKSFSECLELYNNSGIKKKKPSKKSSSTPRRRSNVSGDAPSRSSTIDEQCEEKTTKPRSLRRRSLFGSTTGDEGQHHHGQNEEKPKHRTSRRRRSLLGESTRSTESENTAAESTDSRNTATSTQEEKDAADKKDHEQFLGDSANPTMKPASSRRRGSLNLFGSSHESSSSDDVNKISKPMKKSSSSNPRPRRNSLDTALSTDHDIPCSQQKPPSSRRRGSLDFFTNSTAGDQQQETIEEPKKPSSRRRGSLNFFTTKPGDQETIEAPKKPTSRRRGSLNLFSSTSADQDPETTEEPKKPSSRRRGSFSFFPATSGDEQSEAMPKARRRFSLTKSKCPDEVDGGVVEEEKGKRKEKTKTKKTKNSDDAGDGKQHKRGSFRRLSLGGNTTCIESRNLNKQRSSSRPRRDSLSGSTHSVSSVENNVNVHEYIAELRGEHGLQRFSRNMLMDTIAKQVSRDLAASKGTKCTPTNYYGNVGQGESVGNILETMTTRKGTAQDNILNPYFKEFGVGMTKGKDGIIYMCQVFK